MSRRTVRPRTIHSAERGKGGDIDILEGYLRTGFRPTIAMKAAKKGGGRVAVQASRTPRVRPDTSSGGEGRSMAHANGVSWNDTDTANWSESDSEGQSVALAYKLMTLAKIVREKRRSGHWKCRLPTSLPS